MGLLFSDATSLVQVSYWVCGMSRWRIVPGQVESRVSVFMRFAPALVLKSHMIGSIFADRIELKRSPCNLFSWIAILHLSEGLPGLFLRFIRLLLIILLGRTLNCVLSCLIMYVLVRYLISNLLSRFDFLLGVIFIGLFWYSCCFSWVLIESICYHSRALSDLYIDCVQLKLGAGVEQSVTLADWTAEGFYTSN